MIRLLLCCRYFKNIYPKAAKSKERTCFSLHTDLQRTYCIAVTCGPNITVNLTIERFHSRDYWPYWFTETKESICRKIEFNFQRFSLGHHHGRHFFVLGHQHGRHDAM